ncbi:MAG: tetratricopeptide repeat protein [Rhodoferax sp.]|nr:tetratricopeptide repeat protein [Rhodoferax sp.]
MSLLLDALQRASKDKERAAAGGVAATPPLKIRDTAPGTSYPNLQDSAVAPPAPSTAAAPAPLELSLEATDPAPHPAPEPVVERAPPAVVAPAAPAWEMTELTTPPEPVVQVSPPSPLPAPVAVGVPAPAAPAAPVPNVARPTSETPKVARTVSTSEVQGPAPAKVAQEIRRAYVPDGKAIRDKSTSSRRAMVLGALALVLAVVLGSVLFGMWGDPVAWFGGGSSLATAPTSGSTVAATPTPVPAAAEPALAASDAAPDPVAATTAKPSATSSKQAVATKPLSAAGNTAATEPPRPARKPSGNEVALGGDASKSGFVAKTRGGNALEAGYAALLEGKLDTASQAYTQALNESPEERDALLGLAYIAHKRGQREQAQDFYRRVLRQEPGNATAGAALLALDNDDDNGTNVHRARELAQQQPDSAAAVAMAGGALARSGQVAESVQYFARAQSLEPNNAMHAYNHGVALDRLGQFATARQQYERALALAERGANRGTRTFSVDALRQRVEQLRQAALPKTDGDK